uniref:Putative LOC102452557 [Pelodiscus sinensis] n=1 Tax=Lepeophtheirus salmonis TaxID=72036 RepID=A0A0K2UM25_LEPSM
MLAINNMQLSRNTVTRRLERMDDNILDQLQSDIVICM